LEFAQEKQKFGRGNAEPRRKAKNNGIISDRWFSLVSTTHHTDCHSERSARGVKPRAEGEETAPPRTEVRMTAAVPMLHLR